MSWNDCKSYFIDSEYLFAKYLRINYIMAHSTVQDQLLRFLISLHSLAATGISLWFW